MVDIALHLLRGVVTTVAITIIAFAVSLLIGLLLTSISLTASALLKGAAAVYTEVFRAVPLLTQLFIIYFGLAELGVRLSPITAASLGLGLGGGAIMAEVFRGGLSAVAVGQREAAAAIGMPKWQALRIIVLPQAARYVYAPVGNFAIGLLKATAIASAVAAPEMSFQARLLVQSTFQSTQTYLMLAVFYLALSLPMARVVHKLEQSRDRARAS